MYKSCLEIAAPPFLNSSSRLSATFTPYKIYKLQTTKIKLLDQSFKKQNILELLRCSLRNTRVLDNIKMAIRLNVEPNSVWGFYPNKSVSDKFLEYLDKYGWRTVPRVPVFRVPTLEDLNAFGVPDITREHEYFLLDGNQRLNAAILRKESLPITLFEPTDNIDYQRDHLSNSRTLTYPRRFEVLCYMYAHRNSPDRGIPSRKA